MVKVWLMCPGDKIIKQVDYPPTGDLTLFKSWFPKRHEIRQFFINPGSENEYIVVFFDAEEGGEINGVASWIARRIPVQPTGKFLIMRKKWDTWDGNFSERAIEIDMTVPILRDFIDNVLKR